MKEFLLFILVALVLSSLVLFFNREMPEIFDIQPKRFTSYEELKNFLEVSTEYYSYFGGALTAPMIEQTMVSEAKAGEGEPSADYSRTTIQVEGVDEADIVKTDGKYVYVVSGKKVVILDAYPAEDASILSEIELNGTPNEIFINKDKLTVFGSSYGKTFIDVYDVSDRENPTLVRNISSEGYYFDSRMIGDYVYVIINQPVYYREVVPLPVVYSGNEIKTIPVTEIYYFDVPDYSYRYTTIMAINTQNDNEESSSKVFLMGTTQNMYVSLNNIYITYSKRLSQYYFYDRIVDETIIPVVPEDVKNEIREVKNSDMNKYEKMREIGDIFNKYIESLNPEEAATIMKTVEEKMKNLLKEIAKEMEKTIVHKISVDSASIEYKTSGEVLGYVLNQFSMDEHNGYFRIATTTGSWRSESLNHVYILDDGMKIVGKLEDLAQGERIYSVRFIGDKGYMVTFRQIDPLFVIDLSDSNNPKVLGFLKIPGVSDYLHPYDETHIIGVGRDATEEGRIQGMKLSLFDVSDVSNPVEISKYMIGERGTDSDALRDHKAFLFSKSKNLLVIPIRLSEGGKWNAFQGAYVFNLDLDNGFVLKGRITHTNETQSEEEYYYDYSSQVKRSFYIDNVLYTISGKMIKMNDLENLDEINKVELPYEEEYYPYPIREEVGISSVPS